MTMMFKSVTLGKFFAFSNSENTKSVCLIFLESNKKLGPNRKGSVLLITFKLIITHWKTDVLLVNSTNYSL